MSDADALRLLKTGRKKQHLGKLSALVRVEAGRPRTIKLLAKADGLGWRKLVLGWRNYQDRLVGFLVNGPNMWAWDGNGWRRFNFDVSATLEGASILVRDMLPIPVEDFLVEYRGMTQVGGKEAMVMRLTPKRHGLGLLHQELTVLTSGDQAGLEVVGIEFIDGSWDPRRATYRTVRASWTSLPGGVWLSHLREIGPPPLEAIRFLEWNQDEPVDDGVFNSNPANEPPKP